MDPALSLTGVPRTLLLTTRARVDEHRRADGIFRDPYAAEWWPALEWDTALDPLYVPIAQLSWAVRAHLFDQIVQRHMAAYKSPVVVELGAGLSTRYYRVGQACRCWLELDLPPVTTLRRRFDLESSWHQFVGVSALDFSWMDKVPPGPSSQLLILAEGLLMYFAPQQVSQLVAALRQRFAGATLVFDAVGGITRDRSARQLAQLGAPLQWFIQTEQDIPSLGLDVVELRSLVQENCRYPHRIGQFRWFPWLSHLPWLRNACLVLETRLEP